MYKDMYKELKRHRLQTLARDIAGNDIVVVEFSYNPATDFKKIFLRDFTETKEIIPGKSASETEAWVALKASVAHEAAHLRYSDQIVWEQAVSEGALIQDLLNILEDIRIERAISERFPGTGKWLSWVNRYMSKNRPKIPEPGQRFLYGLLDAGILGKLPNIPEKLLVKRFMKDIRAAKYAPNTANVLEIARKIASDPEVIDLFPTEQTFMPPMSGTFHPEEAPSPECDVNEEDLSDISDVSTQKTSGPEAKTEKGTGTPKTEQDDTDSELEDKPNDEQDDEPSDGPNDELDEPNDEPEDKYDDELDGEPDSEPNNESNSKQEGESNGKPNDKSDGDPNSEPEGEPDDESGGEPNDEPDGESDDEADDKDDEPNDEFDNEPNEPDLGKDESDGDANTDRADDSEADEFDEEQNGKSGLGSDEDDSETDDLNNDFDLEDEVEVELGGIPDDDVLQEAEKELSILIRRGKPEPEEEKLKPTKDFMPVYPGVRDRAPDRRLKPKIIRTAGNKLADELQKILENVKPAYTPAKKGYLDPSKLYKTSFDQEVFRKKSSPQKPELAVYLLVDCSGSMMGEKNYCAVNCVAILEQALNRVGIPFAVTGFNANGGTKIHYYAKRYSDKKCATLLLNTSYGNRDGESIRIAAKEILQRPERQKMLIVLSDGLPNDYGYRSDLPGDFGFVDTARAVRETTKKGVSTIGIHIGDGKADELQRYHMLYPHFIHIENPANLPQVMGRVIKQALKG